MTALPASITFARASIGTYFDKDGVLQTALSGEARFDHDPSTLEPLGLLIEGARTNLQRYSQDFSQWTATLCTIAPAAALDGTTSATEIIPDNTVNTHRLASQASTVNTTSTYTVSFYAKKGAANFVSLSGAGAYNYCAWNLDTGTLAGNGTPWTNPGIQACGNGWYRCYANCIFIGTAVNIQIYGALTVNAAGQPGAAAGDGVAPWITIWGAQIELGSFPTSYIPTTTVTVPRQGDDARMTGVNFSSWYSAAAGTFVLDFIPSQVGATAPLYYVGDDVTNYLRSYQSGTSTNTQASQSSVIVASMATASPAIVAHTPYSLACTHETNRFQVALNGVLPTAVLAGAAQLAINMRMGFAGGVGGNAGYGCLTIASLKFFNIAKTNAELIKLTTP